MRKWIYRAFAFLLSASVFLLAGGYWLIERQGLSREDRVDFDRATVRFDDRGIPTIEARSWLEAIEAQGYVVASERLFQMDLMRRNAAGRLSEWFGKKAIEADRRRKLEDWEGVAARAYEVLPPDEKAYVDAYARGVNRFITAHGGRWGIEYVVLRTEPEPWSGADSMLMILSMAEQLTAFSWMEAIAARWREHIGEAWWSFLFTLDHPWNEPMFGDKQDGLPALPIDHALPMKPIDDAELAPAAGGPPHVRGANPGSNSWAWCGKTGCFLANDPHLGASVPQLWYGLRIRLSADDWVAGVAIPGVPGIILGMNPHLAWAFTNVGEDVDDLLLERLSDDQTQYLAAIEDGREVWRPVVRERRTIKVRDAQDEAVLALGTHRGPLSQRPHLGDGWYSRQWLPLKEGFLRFPVALNRAKNWEEISRALDVMRTPAQNVLVLDRRGNMGYRASGTGIVRPVDGRTPVDAIAGEWLEFEPPAARPRKLVHVQTTSASAADARFLATANERIWVDRFSHRWTEDLRKDRIRRVLSSRPDLGRDDMQRLQLDTTSRYHELLLRWVAARARDSEGQPGAKVMLARWSNWNGAAADDPETFSDALAIDHAIASLCLARVKAHFFPESERHLSYEHWSRSAWIITMLETEGGTKVFGLDEAELASRMLAVALERARAKAPAYHETNRWAAQHPFAKRIPILGPLFAIDTPPQYGWRTVVRVEQPTFGASVRLIWDLADPAKSTWSFPVGQSGHIGSDHYRDLQADWSVGRAFPVFDASWSFGPPKEQP